MKYIAIIGLLLSLNTFAKTETKELFSVKQNQLVLDMVDDICGDTWCEGDYDFNFQSFSCNKTTHQCELKFQFIMDNEGTKQYSKIESCSFENITNFKQLVDTKYSLNDNFYDQLTDCIHEKEENPEF